MVIYPIAQAKAFLNLYREVTSTAPDELGSLVALGTLSDGTQAAVLLAGYSGPIATASRCCVPCARSAPLVDQVGPSPDNALHGTSEHFHPRGYRNDLKTNYLKELRDAMEIMVKWYTSLPAPLFAHRDRTHGRDRQPHGPGDHRLPLPRRPIQLPHWGHVG